MNILITGGMGYIGSHLVVELMNQDHEVVIIDNLVNSHIDVLAKITQITGRTPIFIQDTLAHKPVLKQIMKTYRIELVCHLAALKALSDSVHYPLQYYRNNLVGTLNLIEVMQELNVYKLLFSSSSSVYGSESKIPISETQVLDPISPYGRTKFFIEQILADLVRNSAWQIMVLRYFNVAGAHPSGLIGEEPSDFPSNIIPNMLGVLHKTYPFLSIYGGDYPTLDGTSVRDYIHIQDLVDAHIAAIAHLGWSPLEIYNLGAGKGYSIFELLKLFESITHKTIPYRLFSRRPGDVPQSIANIDKAKVKLAWTPQYSISDICESAWQFSTLNPKG